MMAGVSWFVILTYALNLTYGALGSTRDVLEGRRGHFHLVAWCVPLVLTITCLALSHVSVSVLFLLISILFMHFHFSPFNVFFAPNTDFQQ